MRGVLSNMSNRSTLKLSEAARGLCARPAARMALQALAMFACARCGLFGGMQAAGAALFAAGMCAGWHCGAMLAGCALGCASLGGVEAVWPVFACLSVWLTLCVLGSVELAPYPSRSPLARGMRRACLAARGEGDDVARVALAAGAAGLANLLMTLALAGGGCAGAIGCAVCALLGFGLAPVFAAGLDGLDVPAQWRAGARALLAGACAAGLKGLEWGALAPDAIAGAWALAALVGRARGGTRLRAGLRGLCTGGLLGACLWAAGCDWSAALGYPLAGGLLGGLGGAPGLAAGWAALALTGALGQAPEGHMPALMEGLSALIGIACGAALRPDSSEAAVQARALMQRCLAWERARIDSAAARLVTDVSELVADGGANCAESAEVLRRMGRLAEAAAQRRRAGLARLRVDADASKRVAARLAGYGVECAGVCVTADAPRRAYIELPEWARLGEAPESVERALTYVTGVRFEFEANARDGMLVLRQCGALAVRGAVRRSACGREECGDYALLKRLSDGRYLAGLSDGMGRGRLAARESYAALAAVERLLDCGIAPGPALDAVNDLLRLSGGAEMYATLDIALVDPATGGAQLFKLGALPSVLLGGGRVRLLGAYAPPLGILDRVRAARRSVKLRAGDRLMLLSDGVCDFSNDAQLRALAGAVRAQASSAPGAAAEAAMAHMRRRFGATDDAAVVLLDAVRRDAAWQGALRGRTRGSAARVARAHI